MGDEILTGHFARRRCTAARRACSASSATTWPTRRRRSGPAPGRAVSGSAQAARAAADAAVEHGAAYALCRPPGHHAYADSAGGFCFFNNTAIAAQRLRASLDGPIAILDIDVHHGNGTQGIFWRRGDVLTVSVHADPSNYFPFFAGYADETGEGAGAGFNRNLPLAEGTDDRPWLAAIAAGLGVITGFRPRALVVALGFDASEHDPIGALRVTTAGFAEAARLIAVAHPTIALIQEGGYLCDALPRNLVAFLSAFDEARAGAA